MDFFIERLFIFFSNTFTFEFKSPIVLIWKFLQCLLLKIIIGSYYTLFSVL